MKLELFLLCLNGFVSVTVSVLQSRSTIHFITQTESWYGAQNYCRTHHTDLAMVMDDRTLQEMSKLMRNRNIYSWPIWIGLFNDFNSWRFSTNDLLLTSTNFFNWNSGQPDNDRGNESCGGVNDLGFWEDYDCATLKPFICYSADNNGAERFVGVATHQKSWSEARTHCQTYHTDLAGAFNQSDNDLLAQVASVQGLSWFGLYRDSWKWVNTTIASNLLWGPGQPNTAGLNTCGCVQSGAFSDDACQHVHYFFCESVSVVVYQMVRLQLKSDRSVFNPAVQAYILDKIYQKIEQHGMLQNTTVSWKVQPDGRKIYKKVIH